VVTFVSETLTAPMKIAGAPIANLVASTSGTDSDWVVKLIDLYPDEVGGDAVMGGYQLMIAAEIFRGRYREGFTTAKPITPDSPCRTRTTCSCRGTASWCRFSRAGSPSTTAIHKPSCPTSSGPNPAITRRRRNGSTTPPSRAASSTCPWSRPKRLHRRAGQESRRSESAFIGQANGELLQHFVGDRPPAVQVEKYPFAEPKSPTDSRQRTIMAQEPKDKASSPLRG